MRAISKVRIPTGTYLLQIHRQNFNLEGIVDACCPLCCLEDEDLVHMLTRCPALSETRIIYLNNIKQCVRNDLGALAWRDRIVDASILVQLIVDCQRLGPHILPGNKNLLCAIEMKARMLCYKLHLKRLHLYDTCFNREVPGSDMDANH